MIIALALSLPVFASSLQESVEFAVNPSSATQQEVYHLLARNFEALHPNIKVKVSSRAFNDHKLMIDKLLQGTPTEADVLLIYAGQQLSSLVQAEQLAPINELWQNNNLDADFDKNSKEVISRNGSVYAIPLNYYHWGIYYKKPVFDRLGLSKPNNWTDLLQLIRTLRKEQVTPLLLSGKTTWTLAAWFDYINLRLNGLAFHRSLLSGNVTFTDQKVKEVFRYWRQLIEAGAFDAEQLEFTWTQSLPYFYRDYTAMSLMGNFFMAHVPVPIVETIGYFPFPAIKEGMPTFEDVPVDIAVLNKQSIDKPAVRTFLLYLANLDTQSALSNYVGKIAAHRLAKSKSNPFTASGKIQIEEAAGFAQFFDRDTPKAFSESAMAIFKKFVTNPDNLESVLLELEALRKHTFIGKN